MTFDWLAGLGRRGNYSTLPSMITPIFFARAVMSTKPPAPAVRCGVADSREVHGLAGLLALADLRLYQSKAAGRNQVSP